MGNLTAEDWGNIAGFVSAGGVKQGNPLYVTKTGFSAAEPQAYFAYLSVVFLVFNPGIIGRQTRLL